MVKMDLWRSEEMQLMQACLHLVSANLEHLFVALVLASDRPLWAELLCCRRWDVVEAAVA